MVWPIVALKGLTAAQKLAEMAEKAASGQRTAKATSRDMDRAAKDITKGSTAIKKFVGESEGKPTESSELSLEHPAEAWAHRGDPGWFMDKTVKAGFRAPDGSREYLWVKVVSSGRSMVGQLLTQPVAIDARVGATMTFKPNDIVDVQLGGGSSPRHGRREV